MSFLWSFRDYGGLQVKRILEWNEIKICHEISISAYALKDH